MGAISEIVTVNITASGTAIKQAGFGTPLILDYHTKNLDRIRFYSDLAGMISDGFTTNDAAYRAAAACFSQNPQVPQVAIGRRSSNPIITVEVTPVAANLTVYSMEIVGPSGSGTATFTSDSSALVAEITAGLVGAINALAVGVTAVDNTTKLTVTATVATNWFAVNPLSLSLFLVAQTQADTSPSTSSDLATIQAVNNDWYGVTLTTEGKLEILSAASFVESNEKLGVFGTQDTAAINATAGNVTLAAAAETRSNIFFHEKGSAFPGAALLGYLSYAPGALTFEFKSLAGVTASPLTATHIANLNTAYAGFYASYGGTAMFRDSHTAAGTFMDLIRDRDWLKARMQARVLTLLVNNPKVPFTDAGISAVAAEVRAQLQEGVRAGYLAEFPEPVVTVPKAANVNPVDKANRYLNAITWSATAAGAIHRVAINGTVSV